MTPEERAAKAFDDVVQIMDLTLVEGDRDLCIDTISCAIRLAVRAELERLVPELCEACRLDHKPIRHDFGGPQAWAHRLGGKPCPASPIHEALRK